MKTDLATAIGAAIVGFILAFFVTNLLTGEIEDFTYKTVETTVTTNLDEPDPEVFNYRALNPTVEVYVGTCTEYDSNGECIENEEENPDGEDQENS